MSDKSQEMLALLAIFVSRTSKDYSTTIFFEVVAKK